MMNQMILEMLLILFEKLKPILCERNVIFETFSNIYEVLLISKPPLKLIVESFKNKKNI